MSIFELFFADSRTPELISTVYSPDANSHPLVMLRGKKSVASFNSQPLQWTSAVRALALLMVRTASWDKDSSGLTPIILGTRNTAAASLDYALSKQTNWLLDMFGMDESGEPVCRKIIKRSNPERKRPGPVVLSVNSQYLPAKDILVYVGSERLTDADELNRLTSQLGALWDEEPTDETLALPFLHASSALRRVAAGVSPAPSTSRLAHDKPTNRHTVV